jgi:hypothetical protein
MTHVPCPDHGYLLDLAWLHIFFLRKDLLLFSISLLPNSMHMTFSGQGMLQSEKSFG